MHLVGGRKSFVRTQKFLRTRRKVSLNSLLSLFITYFLYITQHLSAESSSSSPHLHPLWLHPVIVLDIQTLQKVLSTNLIELDRSCQLRLRKTLAHPSRLACLAPFMRAVFFSTNWTGLKAPIKGLVEALQSGQRPSAWLGLLRLME